MQTMRDIIEINEDLCNGCGQCILDCAEGALVLENGKAKLKGEFLCDGLGACLGGCPTGALRIIKRPAQPFDEAAVAAATGHQCAGQRGMELPTAPQHPAGNLPCGCPGSQAGPLPVGGDMASCAGAGLTQASQLGHWPIKLQLLPANASFINGRPLMLLADCAGVAHPNLHRDLLPGQVVALACPKLDNAQAHIDKLALVLQNARPSSLSVVHMEVPCCRGLEHIARQALLKAGLQLPSEVLIVSRQGLVIQRMPLP